MKKSGLGVFKTSSMVIRRRDEFEKSKSTIHNSLRVACVDFSYPEDTVDK